jgi:hypothetical protein
MVSDESVLTESNLKVIVLNGPMIHIHRSLDLYLDPGPSEIVPDVPPVFTVFPSAQHAPVQFGFVATYCPV